jgi:transcription antitermination protein NusB
VRRRKSRELALRMLYQLETNSSNPERALENYCNIFPYQQDVIDYAESLMLGVKKDKAIIDTYIQDASEHWKISRITFVDKNILRIGIYEMLFSEDVPPKVAIDEAIELAKKYGNEDSGNFINGILDKVFKDYYKEKRHADESRT